VARTRILVAGVAAALAGIAVLLGGTLAGSGPAPAPAPSAARPSADAAGPLLTGVAAGDTASLVRSLETRLAANPEDGESLTLLGLAYQQRARETGDPSFYPLSERTLRKAIAHSGDDYLATTGLASLAAARHRFENARALAEKAIALSPTSAAPYGVLGDALIELGRYEEAFTAFDRMASIKPNIASYARVSYARELLGRPDEAVEAMELAVDAGSGNPENHAWTLVQLGNLHFDSGRVDRAARLYRTALDRLPGYVYAQAGLARVEAARGRTRSAVALYRSALETNPLPQFAAALGDTLAAAGRRDEAGEAYALVDVIQRLFEANGVRTELETALFDLDHDRGVADALARAEEAYDDRKSIEAEDVLAWAYYKNGRCEDALSHSRRALRLGTKDALKLFHRGMIERCLGRDAAGERFLRQALETNPHFSLLYAPVVEEAVA
jgi:tetratricopeptide (TPR) repeat protein